jgi:hypothetical protein
VEADVGEQELVIPCQPLRVLSTSFAHLLFSTCALYCQINGSSWTVGLVNRCSSCWLLVAGECLAEDMAGKCQAVKLCSYQSLLGMQLSPNILNTSDFVTLLEGERIVGAVHYSAGACRVQGHSKALHRVPPQALTS